ncbi:MAG: EF-hand domain-containing protein [Gammaproteobacteria bacterium]|nr:EF-hand domain-containing protein [Gammaproteobacteria bacterium]
MKQSHLKQPQKKLFKHSIIAALVMSLGGISFASFAETTTTPVAASTVTTTAAPTTDDHAARKARWEEFHAKHEQERIERRTEMFKQADTNHDGKVSLAEWLAFKPPRPDHRPHDGQEGPRDEQDQNDHPDGKNLAEWLKKVDANHDGQISKAEAESYAPRIAKHFDEIDTNHDGLVSQDELKAFFDAKKAKHEQRMIEHRTEEFKKADTNHDGQLTLEEWLAFKPHHHHGFWRHHGDHHKGFENRFQKLDTNHDGSISLSEAQAGAPEIAKHFNEIDTDHNGQISQDELHAFFKAQHEKSPS